MARRPELPRLREPGSDKLVASNAGERSPSRAADEGRITAVTSLAPRPATPRRAAGQTPPVALWVVGGAAAVLAVIAGGVMYRR